MHQPIKSESCPVVEGNNDIKHYKKSSSEGHVSNVSILGQFPSFLCGFWLKTLPFRHLGYSVLFFIGNDGSRISQIG